MVKIQKIQDILSIYRRKYREGSNTENTEKYRKYRITHKPEIEDKNLFKDNPASSLSSVYQCLRVRNMPSYKDTFFNDVPGRDKLGYLTSKPLWQL